MMFNLFKKKEKNKDSKYPFGQNVSFDVAFKALCDGYLIRTGYGSDIYWLLIKGKIYEIIDRDDCSGELVKSIDTFYMLLKNWQIVEPNTIQKRDK